MPYQTHNNTFTISIITRFTIVAFVFLTIVTGTLFADIVVLLDGRTFFGEIVAKDKQKLTIITRAGEIPATLTFPMNMVDTITIEEGDQSPPANQPRVEPHHEDRTPNEDNQEIPSDRDWGNDAEDPADLHLLRGDLRGALQVLLEQDDVLATTQAAIILADPDAIRVGINTRMITDKPLPTINADALRAIALQTMKGRRLLAEAILLKLIDPLPSEKPIELLQESGKNGDMLARLRLASLAFSNRSFPINHREIREWLREASGFKVPAATYLFAKCYDRDGLANPDNNKFMSLLRRSAAEGHVEGCFEYGRLANDLSISRRYLSTAFELGHGAAALHLYLNGFGEGREVELLLYACSCKVQEAIIPFLHFAYDSGSHDVALRAIEVAKEAWKSDIALLGIRIFRSPGETRVSGLAYNLTGQHNLALSLDCVARNSRGEPISRTRAWHSTLTDLGHEVVRFVAILPENPAIARATLEASLDEKSLKVDYLDSESFNLAHRFIMPRASRSPASLEAWPAGNWAQGQVRNRTNYTISELRPERWLFTDNGFVLEVLRGDCQYDPILPNQVTPFQVSRPRSTLVYREVFPMAEGAWYHADRLTFAIVFRDGLGQVHNYAVSHSPAMHRVRIPQSP